MAISLPLKGRGAADNPTGRFEPLHYEEEPPEEGAEQAGPRTQVYIDASKSVITANDSPDIGPKFYVNPYRGCEHGCSYCYARPYHEYLGLSAGLDFETKIFAKPTAAALLREELRRPSWRGEPIGLSGVTDCYQPIERSLRITRGCLEVMAEFRQAVGIVTKNRLVTRDADLLSELAQCNAACVWLSLTTLDEELARAMEPRATAPLGRLAAIRELTAAGVPTGVMIAPIIPGLNDHEIPALLEAAKAAGAKSAGLTMLRLPFGVKELFSGWLTQHYPERKEKVLGRVREVRGGKLNDARFRARMTGTGVLAETIGSLFRLHRRRVGLAERLPPLDSSHFRRPGERQLSLFA